MASSTMVMNGVACKSSTVIDHIERMRSTPQSKDSPAASSNDGSDGNHDNHKQMIKSLLLIRNGICELVAEISKIVPSKSGEGIRNTGTTADAVSVVDSGEPSTEPIVSQPEQCFEKFLDPVFDALIRALESGFEWHSNGEMMNESEALLLLRGTTPLAIACDKGNQACLKYFLGILVAEASITEPKGSDRRLFRGRWSTVSILEALIGNPLVSRSVPDGNTPVHHLTTEAAILAQTDFGNSSGQTALEVLEAILMAQKSLRHRRRRCQIGNSIGCASVSQDGGDGSSIGATAFPETNIVLAFGGVTNNHGDTPLMLAVANNVVLPKCTGADSGDQSNASSAARFLEGWHALASSETSAPQRETPEPRSLQQQQQQQIHEAIRKVLTATNQSGNSVFSYALKEGLVEVVRWLIRIDHHWKGGTGQQEDEPQGHIIPSHAYVDCQHAMKHIDSVLKLQPPEIRKIAEGRRRAFLECARLVEAHVVGRSEETARELLLLEKLEDAQKSTSEKGIKEVNNKKENSSETQRRKKKKKKKKEEQEQEQEQRQPQQLSSKEDSNDSQHNNFLAVGEESETNKRITSALSSTRIGNRSSPSDTTSKSDSLLLTKLASGRLAVKVANESQFTATERAPTVLPSTLYRKRTFSLDETNRLMRDRYRQGSSNATTSQTTLLAPSIVKPAPAGNSPTAEPEAGPAIVPPSTASDADSVLSALCLDVNCLLYSDHGMALNLSPAQLDAVEHILREQLQSVQKARSLQKRRCRAGASMTAGNAADTGNHSIMGP